MDASFFNVLHDAGDERVLAVAEAVHIDLGCIRKIAVDKQRTLPGDHKLIRPVEIAGKPRDIAVELRSVTVSGASSDDEVVVEKGLAAGESVVTDGQVRLAPGASVTVAKNAS